jgi:hypothetical protein
MSEEYKIKILDADIGGAVNHVCDIAKKNHLTVKCDKDSIWFKDKNLPEDWFYDVRLTRNINGFSLVVAGYSLSLCIILENFFNGLNFEIRDDFDDIVTLKNIFHI